MGPGGGSVVEDVDVGVGPDVVVAESPDDVGEVSAVPGSEAAGAAEVVDVDTDEAVLGFVVADPARARVVAVADLASRGAAVEVGAAASETVAPAAAVVVVVVVDVADDEWADLPSKRRLRVVNGSRPDSLGPRVRVPPRVPSSSTVTD